MTAPISGSWTRIENWLAEHAPATYAALAPPADPSDIAALEHAISRPLLKPLRMSLLRHDGLLDGRSSLVPGFDGLLSAREISAEWRFLGQWYDKLEADEKGEEEVDYDFMRSGSSRILFGHPQLIPIAREVGGGCLVVDHRPEIDRGRIHFTESTEGATRRSHEMWTSLPVLMETIATSLENSQPLDDHMPVVDEAQRLDWDYIPLRDDRTFHRS
ncbi:SMI1/KNR4 family protein [Streptomyces sp. NPDC051563]|uniref:SMI1/KNR4 family protein n=1 Tax=unclassified Streptomyces TaxID=2593676 RepID=UPI00378DB8BE